VTDSSLPALRLDADKIEQALSNLLGNAIEHSMAGSTVTIRLKDTGEQVLFCVQDSGPGIAADEMHHLFSPFSKTSTTKTAGEKSTGLGLTIARKIVEAHQGEIRAESTVGRGTTFYINLPKG
jgi:signal transduction histidine kinase